MDESSLDPEELERIRARQQAYDWIREYAARIGAFYLVIFEKTGNAYVSADLTKRFMDHSHEDVKNK